MGCTSATQALAITNGLTHRLAPNGNREFRHWAGFQMLPGADMPLLWDPKLRKIVEEYYHDRQRLRVDCCKAWKKLTTLGCDDLQEEVNFDEDIMANWGGGAFRL